MPTTTTHPISPNASSPSDPPAMLNPKITITIQNAEYHHGYLSVVALLENTGNVPIFNPVVYITVVDSTDQDTILIRDEAHPVNGVQPNIPKGSSVTFETATEIPGSPEHFSWRVSSPTCENEIVWSRPQQVLVPASLPIVASSAQRKKADETHKNGICGEISRLIDLSLYDNPHIHGNTTSCSYSDERLLILPNQKLTEERMARFVFLAFVAAGALCNDDFMMPDKVYVGYGQQCQVMDISAVARLQKAAKYYGDSGMRNAMIMARDAPKISCY